MQLSIADHNLHNEKLGPEVLDPELLNYNVVTKEIIAISTPSLNVVTEAAKSGIPALGYAGTYTFANVLLTFAGTILVRL